MIDSPSGLRRTIGSAVELQSVVRTMKAVAASSIGPYEKSVLALNDYHRTVELGLGACLRAAVEAPVPMVPVPDSGAIAAIVFGSDQGLVGRFNEAIAEHVVATLAALPARRNGDLHCWAVGERVHARLADAGLSMAGRFALPASVQGIAPLVGRIQVESEAHRSAAGYARVYVFHNRPAAGPAFEPVDERLLPLDDAWQRAAAAVRWPGATLPDALPDASAAALRGFVREHLFIALYRACAESLASENASRLAAMQRADRNIDELLQDLQGRFHRVRQDRIDEELFDVTAGFMALS